MAARVSQNTARTATILLGLQLITFCRPALALDPTRAITQSLHRIWQVQQGLPTGTIYSILQSRDGYLWLGTQNGLVRFDGVRFTFPPAAGGISPDKLWVQDLHEGNDHSLWLATAGDGLIRLRDESATRYGRADGLPSDNVQCLMQDHQGTLWVGTDHGIVTFANGKFAPTAGDLPVNVRGICEFDDGTVWAGGDANRLGVWNGTRFVARKLLTIPANSSVRAIRCAPGGVVWVGTSSGLVRLEGNSERRIGRADGLADDSVLCLEGGSDGSLFVGTVDGFSRIRGGEIKTFRTQDGLSQSSASALRVDREGSLWVGTKHGLNQFLDRRTIPFTATEGLPTNDTGPVVSDGHGNVWVGTLGAGLCHFDGHHFSVMTGRDGLSDENIIALACNGDDLWIGTAAGLDHLIHGRVDRSYGADSGLPSVHVRCLLVDADGALWVGTAAGVAFLRDGHFFQPDAPGGNLKSTIHALGLHAGAVYVAADGGRVFVYRQNALQPVQQSDLSTYDIDSFFDDAEGTLWMGTRGGGLLTLGNGPNRVYSMRDGLYDDDIFGIVSDDHDNLWMGCSKGIFSVNRADLRKFAAGELKAVSSTPFSPTDAQRTIECKAGVQPSVCRLADGHVWFSTIHGLIVIDTENIQRKVSAPPVVIEEAVVNGNRENLEKLTALRAGPTNLEFRYTALSFISPARMTFRYKLDGFDRDWVDAGQRREAFYTNLPPGNYRFLVTAGNIDGTWSASAAPIAFRVPPLFYQRRWFLPTVAAVALWLAWLLYRLRVRRIREQHHAVVTERSRIARELHDTLMQGFSGITMEMQALSNQLDPSPQRGVLQEIIRDAGICLREARQSIAGLRTSRDAGSGLVASIDQASRQIVESKGVRLKLRLGNPPRNLPADVEYNLLRISQEAVLNCVKHSGARSIEVGLECTPRFLALSVSDDGSGTRNEVGLAAPPGHYGLIGMRERAAQIGAEFQFQSEPGRGTRIVVRMPLGKAIHGPASESRDERQEVAS